MRIFIRVDIHVCIPICIYVINMYLCREIHNYDIQIWKHICKSSLHRLTQAMTGLRSASSRIGHTSSYTFITHFFWSIFHKWKHITETIICPLSSYEERTCMTHITHTRIAWIWFCIRWLWLRTTLTETMICLRWTPSHNWPLAPCLFPDALLENKI